jgi:solute carrier family 25 2-oxodicarboxylate transporter 21
LGRSFANESSEAPKRAVKFSANDEWGRIYRKAFGQEKMNQSLSVLTGASAGATEAVVVVPFELVKIRLQDKASAGKYNGMLDVVVKSKSNPNNPRSPDPPADGDGNRLY